MRLDLGEGRPIDCAPRDCEFLAYDPIAGCFDVCEFSKFLGFVWPVQVNGECGPDDCEFQGDRATLWWPLPSQ